MTAALLVGVLVAGGVYMIMRRELLRVALGFVLLGHAVNILFIAAGGLDWREPALLGQSTPEESADPLPQAFVLTAIVITFGITVYLLALMRAQGLRDREERAARTAESPDTPAAVAAGAPPEEPSGAAARAYAVEHGPTRGLPPDGATEPASHGDQPGGDTDDTADPHDQDTGNGTGKDQR